MQWLPFFRASIVCLTPSIFYCLLFALKKLGWVLYACREFISFSRSFKDKFTISSKIVVQILYNIPDKYKNKPLKRSLIVLKQSPKK